MAVVASEVYQLIVESVGGQEVVSLDRQINKLRKDMALLPNTVGSTTKGVAVMGSQMGRLGSQVQNASFQITDFIVQVQGGTSAFVALGQQLPQVLGAFGAIGAALGVAAAVGPIAVKSLLDLADGMGRASKEAEAFNELWDNYEAAVEGALTPTLELAETFGRFTEEVQKGRDQLVALQVADLTIQFNELTEAVSGSVERLDKLDILDAQGPYLRNLALQLKITAEEYTNLSESAAALEAAEGLEDQLDAAVLLRDAIVATGQEAGTLRDVYEQITGYIEDGAKFATSQAKDIPVTVDAMLAAQVLLKETLDDMSAAADEQSLALKQISLEYQEMLAQTIALENAANNYNKVVAEGEGDVDKIKKAIVDAALAGRDLASLDLAGGIDAAAVAAQYLAEYLGTSLEHAKSILTYTDVQQDSHIVEFYEAQEKAQEKAARAAERQVAASTRAANRQAREMERNRQQLETALTAMLTPIEQAELKIQDLKDLIASIGDTSDIAGIENLDEVFNKIRLDSVADSTAVVQRAMDSMKTDAQLAAEEADAIAEAFKLSSTYIQYTDEEIALITASMERLREGVDETGEEIALIFGDQITNAMNGLIDQTLTVEEAFEGMLTGILQDIAKFLVSQQIQQFLTFLTGSAIPGLFGTSAAPVSSPTPVPRPFSAAVPAQFSSPAPTSGLSVLTAAVPSLLSFGAAASTNYVSPQQQRYASGGGQGVSPTVVNVYNQGGAEVETNESVGPNGEQVIDILIERKVKGLFDTGAMDKTMSQTYGVRRRPA